METLPPLFFEVGGLAGREVSEVPDDIVPIGEAIFPDGQADQRLQNLLGAPTADAECQFERGAVDPRGGKCLKLPNSGFQPGIPYGFVWHRLSDREKVI